MQKSLENLFFLLGVLSTLNALIITIGSNQLAVINIIILIIILLQFIYTKGKLFFYKYKIIIVIICLIFIISTLGSTWYLPSLWSKDSITATLKFCFILLPIIIVFSDKELNIYRKHFFKGLLLSAWIQLVWEMMQLFLFYGFSLSLNQLVFGDLLKIQTDHTWSFILDNQFRPSGVSWEPANLSLALIMGLVLTRNFLGKVVFSFGIIASTSRTGIVLLILCIGFYIIYYIKKNNIKENLKVKWSSLLFLTFTSLSFFIILVYLVQQPKIIDLITQTFQRFSSGINLNESSAAQHSNYYWQAFKILNESSIFQVFFGYGTGVAGFPFSYYFDIFSWLKTSWNPESDFITLFVGNGVLGFFFYYYFLYKCTKFNKYNFDFYLILLMIFFSGFMYIYIRSSWSLLICLLLFNKSELKKEII